MTSGDGYDEWLAACAEACRNCPECCECPCAACCAGGVCDQMRCRCDDDDGDEWIDDDEDL